MTAESQTASLTEEDLALMERRHFHRTEPWRPDANDVGLLRQDNASLIAEVRKLRKALLREAK